ncbi:MAG: ferrous iron transport protein B [Spirochaetes bacterium]|jgi:ferrous iron transport protein B|nr:ferrous iron transport protein B [Spirochaetota bacterium]
MSATVAIVGNPNSGKTTIFNGLTGGRQRIGNWPGVTVERKEGSFTPKGLGELLVKPFAAGSSHTTGATSTATLQEPSTVEESEAIRVVDLPGIYSLSASSEDEAIARDYLLSGEPDLVIDVVDASNIQRNLFLTLQLIEMRIPVLVVLNMMDVAEESGISIDVEHLSEHLQCPVVAAVGTRAGDISRVKAAVAGFAGSAAASQVEISYPDAIEAGIAELGPRVETLSALIGATPRWTALSVLDSDPWIRRRFLETSGMGEDELDTLVGGVQERLGDDIDVALADAKYGFIHGLSRHVTREQLTRESLTERVDRVVLNRILALPIFFGVMYLVFWFTMYVGGAFIDFFDILFGTIFVDGFGAGLAAVGSPPWLVALLAGGVGSGLQTVATFVPILFAMFATLAVLEDSGYMARAAYVMDRMMRWIGLPGKSFVPMMVGFGCTVPAIMATRTLQTRRDRFMTAFMSPFMSCGARLPVYALFAAAFFAGGAGSVVFSLYVIGIVVAIGTGFLLKHTLFRGEVSHFVMELPPYHAPRLRFVLSQAWHRLSAFVKRAGVTITLIVTVLAFMNSMGTDGTVGNEDAQSSVLSSVGRAITPVFTPMGVEEDNWAATVGLFSGLFAKEAVVGTLNSLYGQADAEPGAGGVDFLGGITEAFRSIPAAFAGAGAGLADPLGTGMVSDDPDAIGEELGTDATLFERLRTQFSPQAAYAYLLFVLLYFPCVAALAAAIREMGQGLGWLLAAYTTVVAWSGATLYYQFATGPQVGAVTVAVSLLVVFAATLWILGRTVFRPAVIERGT